MWKRQLNFAQECYGRYILYSNFSSDLNKISTYCNANNIKIQFFVPPTHVDLQNKIFQAGLEEVYKDFQKVMMRYPVTNFDYPNALTKNMDNFKDPFHFTEEVAREVIKELFGLKSSDEHQE